MMFKKNDYVYSKVFGAGIVQRIDYTWMVSTDYPIIVKFFKENILLTDGVTASFTLDGKFHVVYDDNKCIVKIEDTEYNHILFNIPQI